jgi:hypothetical protein
MVPIDTGPSDATQGYENSRNCIRFGDLFPLCFDSCIVGTISADDPVRQYITLQHTLADRLTPLQWIPNPHHANLPIRAMASGEPFPCTYLLTQPSAQLASPPSPIYKTTTSRGRSVIGSPVCSSSTPAYRILRYVRYLLYRHASSCVLQPAIQTVHATATENVSCRYRCDQLRGMLSLSLSRVESWGAAVCQLRTVVALHANETQDTTQMLPILCRGSGGRGSSPVDIQPAACNSFGTPYVRH